LQAPGPRFVLVTRPQPGADETARRLTALGRHPLVAPLLRLSHVAAPLPKAASLQAVLVTSGSALPALSAHHACRLLVVGDATATRARTAGFTEVHSAGADAIALAGLVRRLCDPAGPPLLLASGARQGRPLAATLRRDGFHVIRREVYAARVVTTLPEPAATALAAGQIDTALFFSAATARAFVDLLGAALPISVVAGVEAVAIAPATASALSPLPWRRIRVASAPNQDAILALML
jgi:uroporphyrinogen-III synthase